jgi:hypothetical protein
MRYLSADEKLEATLDRIENGTRDDGDVLSFAEAARRLQRFAYGALLRAITHTQPDYIDPELRGELVTDLEIAQAVLGIEPDDGGLSAELNSSI